MIALGNTHRVFPQSILGNARRCYREVVVHHDRMVERGSQGKAGWGRRESPSNKALWESETEAMRAES